MKSDRSVGTNASEEHMHPSSGLTYVPPKFWYPPTRIQDVTTQKTQYGLRIEIDVGNPRKHGLLYLT
jgi:hypothetical protein